VLDACTTSGTSIPVGVMVGCIHIRSSSGTVGSPTNATPSSIRTSRRNSAGSASSATRRARSSSVIGRTSSAKPATAIAPRSSCRLARSRTVAVSASGTAPPHIPECTGCCSDPDGDGAVDQPAQRVGEPRPPDLPVGEVGEHDHVRVEEVCVRSRNAGQVGRRDLLLALDHHLDVDGQRPAGVQPPAHRGDVGQHPGLVVGGAAAEEPPVAHGGLERRGGPPVRAPDGLDVVVGVQQHRRGVGAGAEPVAGDVRVRPVDLEQLHVLEAGAPQQVGGRLGGPADLRGVVAGGADRRDAAQRDEVGDGGGHPVRHSGCDVLEVGRDAGGGRDHELGSGGRGGWSLPCRAPPRCQRAAGRDVHS
jgi:hypothetical protein